jgi:hypothetical protein
MEIGNILKWDQLGVEVTKKLPKIVKHSYIEGQHDKTRVTYLVVVYLAADLKCPPLLAKRKK